MFTDDNLCYVVNVYVAPSHGLGIFAGEDIKRGQVVWRHNENAHKELTEQEYLDSEYRSYIFQCFWTGKYFLPLDISRYENHSEYYNTVGVPVPGASPSEMIAVRDIKKGEEICSNYRIYDLRWKEKLGIVG